jgi:hypothetical protein
LRLAHAAVTKQEDLDLSVDPLAGLKVLVMGADLIHDIFPVIFAADLCREVVKLAMGKIEYLQLGQQRFQRAELSDAFASSGVIQDGISFYNQIAGKSLAICWLSVFRTNQNGCSAVVSFRTDSFKGLYHRRESIRLRSGLGPVMAWAEAVLEVELVNLCLTCSHEFSDSRPEATGQRK